MEFVWDFGRADVHRSDGCDVHLWRPAPCLLVSHVVGRGTLVALQYYAAYAERAMSAGKLTVFHDWSQMHGYDPGARDMLKRWGRDHNAAFNRVTYLVESKVIAMLISVAALTLRRELHATTDRSLFLAELDAALAAVRT